MLVDTTGKDWMVPFAEHLGVITPEFETWKKALTTDSPCVLLVEGELDQLYFSFLRENYPLEFPLPENVEIVPYGGKDALKNTTILKFMIEKIGKLFVTYDLDSSIESKRALDRLGLIEGADYIGVGIDKPGRQAVEGLLPERILKAVHGRETDLMMAASSANASERNEAKNKIKRLLLGEFREGAPYSRDDLKNFAVLGRIIAKKFRAGVIKKK